MTTKAEHLAGLYLNGLVEEVMLSILEPLSNVTARMVMEHLPPDTQSRFWSEYKPYQSRTFEISYLSDRP